MPSHLTPHETIELHEILNFKTTCVNKAAAMSNMVSDQQLLSLIKQDVETGKTMISDLTMMLQGR